MIDAETARAITVKVLTGNDPDRHDLQLCNSKIEEILNEKIIAITKMGGDDMRIPYFDLIDMIRESGYRGPSVRMIERMVVNLRSKGYRVIREGAHTGMYISWK